MPRPRGGVLVRSFSRPLLGHCSIWRAGFFYRPSGSFVLPFVIYFSSLAPNPPVPTPSPAVPASGSFFPLILFLSNSQIQSHHESQFFARSYSGNLHSILRYLSAGVGVLWISPSLASPRAKILTCEAPGFWPFISHSQKAHGPPLVLREDLPQSFLTSCHKPSSALLRISRELTSTLNLLPSRAAAGLSHFHS